MPLFIVSEKFEDLDIDAFALPYNDILDKYYSINYYKSEKLINIFAKLYKNNKLVYFKNQSVILNHLKKEIKDVIDNSEEPVPRFEDIFQYLTKEESTDKEIEEKFTSIQERTEEIIDEFNYCTRKRNRAIEILLKDYYFSLPSKDLELTINKDFDKPIIMLNYMICRDIYISDVYKKIIEFALQNNFYKIAIPIINFDEKSSQRSIDIAKSTVRSFISNINEDITVYLILIQNNNNYYLNHKLDEKDDRFIEYEEIKKEKYEEKQEEIEEKEEKDSSFNIRLNECRNIRCEYAPPQKKKKDFDCLIKERLEKKNESFSEMVMRKIYEKNIGKVECYKAANVNKNIFSKITKEIQRDVKKDGSLYIYHPDKKIVLAFIIALKLNHSEAEELMNKAGFAFTSSPQDVIVQLFIEKGIYDIDYVNQYMFRYNQPLLGTTTRE